MSQHFVTKEGLQTVITQLVSVKGELGIIKWMIGLATTGIVLMIFLVVSQSELL